MDMELKTAKCPVCKRLVTVTSTGTLVTHGHILSGDCGGSGAKKASR
jgi:hypothetical protein